LSAQQVGGNKKPVVSVGAKNKVQLKGLLLKGKAQRQVRSTEALRSGVTCRPPPDVQRDHCPLNFRCTSPPHLGCGCQEARHEFWRAGQGWRRGGEGEGSDDAWSCQEVRLLSRAQEAIETMLTWCGWHGSFVWACVQGWTGCRRQEACQACWSEGGQWQAAGICAWYAAGEHQQQRRSKGACQINDA